MFVEVHCDAAGCDEVESEPVGLEDGVNSIQAHTEGWEHTGIEDYCPKHADGAENEDEDE